ncbi:hypothetical protein GSI_12229 [Ganoderma sinense ZZ0214-1]|uniref:BTB domain-containing protein n=1 Tax=Ganoderma sinense ZZ0214-1 TaxID=1077348 RepID=A0A2G8RY79_9APHY|nr:hypothetical protein GSI_12229 [Ganoderma sinense ZZ0214-1]
MSGEGRPLKRARLGTTADPASSTFPFERHNEFWLPDGNVILVANKTTAFRIYRSLIASQSTVFEDMFTASTSNNDEVFEGCPVVHLSDSPQDLAHLLGVLLPRSRRLYHGTSPTTFYEISAVIRLAHKYHIQDVQDQALASLQAGIFSSDFDGWFKVPASEYLKNLDPIAAISIVNLAHLTDTPSLLPGALYACTYLEGKVLDGWTREDGTVEHLALADLRRCLNAHRVLALEVMLLPARIFALDARVEGCKTWARCRLARQSVLPRVLSSEAMTAGRRALSGWKVIIKAMGEGKEGNEQTVCKACEKALFDRNRRERWLHWKRLPEIFGITVEGWGSETEGEDTVDA